MSDAKPKGVLQADGSVRSEPSVQSRDLLHTSLSPDSHSYRVMDARYAGEAVVYMANLPLEVNILNQVSRSQNTIFGL
jgi:hypothetical protein